MADLSQERANGTRPLAQARLELAQAEALLALSATLNADLQLGRVLETLLDGVGGLVRADRAAIFLRRRLLTDFDAGLRQSPVMTASGDVTAAVTRQAQENPVIGSLADGSISLSTAGLRGGEPEVICAAARAVPPDYQRTLVETYGAALTDAEPEAERLLRLLERPFYVRDAAAEYRIDSLRPASTAAGVRSLLSLPLVHRAKMLGWFVLFHNAPYLYRESETNSLGLCANQAAMAISNALLYDEAHRRAREAQQIGDAVARFGSSLELHDVLRFVAESAAALLGARTLLFLLNRDGSAARPVARAGVVAPANDDNPPIADVETGTFGLAAYAGGPIVPGEGAVGMAIQTGLPYFGRDAQQARPAAPFLSRSGDTAPTSLIAFPLKGHGRTFGAVLAYTCRAERGNERLEDRHVALGAALADRAALAIENARLYDTLRRDQRTKDEFLSLVAHELRTPLTTIKGYNANLRKQIAALDTTGDPLLRYTDVITTQIERLARLIEDLLDISRLEMGRFALNVQDEDIVEIAQAALENAKAMYAATRPDPAARRHIFSGGTNRPHITVRLDRARFEQVLQNLLSNAVKYAPRGGPVLLTVVDAGDRVRVAVEDRGLGIPATDQPHIFDKYYRSAAHPNKAGGLGLGLYIVRAIVEAHGGTVSVSSTEGAGSIFTVTLDKAPPTK